MPEERAGAAAGAPRAGRAGAGRVLEWRGGRVGAGAAIARTALLVDVIGSFDVAGEGAGEGRAVGELGGTRNVRRERRGGGAVGKSAFTTPLC